MHKVITDLKAVPYGLRTGVGSLLWVPLIPGCPDSLMHGFRGGCMARYLMISIIEYSGQVVQRCTGEYRSNQHTCGALQHGESLAAVQAEHDAVLFQS